MTGKFAKISRLEWVTLLLTACFAAGTLLWFHFGPPPGAVTFTGTGEPTAAEQQAEQTPGGPWPVGGGAHRPEHGHAL